MWVKIKIFDKLFYNQFMTNPYQYYPKLEGTMGELKPWVLWSVLETNWRCYKKSLKHFNFKVLQSWSNLFVFSTIDGTILGDDAFRLALREGNNSCFSTIHRILLLAWRTIWLLVTQYSIRDWCKDLRIWVICTKSDLCCYVI